jgi:zinc-finger of a C2HC-type
MERVTNTLTREGTRFITSINNITLNNSFFLFQTLSNRSAASSASSRTSSVVASKLASATSTPSTPLKPVNAGPPPEGMATCQFCSRNFNEDRLQKHEEICKKTKQKKRRVFDAVKARVEGTEAEQYVKKASKSKKPAAAAVESKAKSGNWRKKHEEFIAAIRAAKEVQAHLARGGKLSDLPPPPPSENPDYVQCPHCQRRFNESAASRHIPKCATMLHNKTKKAPPAKKR